jgi:hypothetical protein
MTPKLYHRNNIDLKSSNMKSGKPSSYCQYRFDLPKLVGGKDAPISHNITNPSFQKHGAPAGVIDAHPIAQLRYQACAHLRSISNPQVHLVGSVVPKINNLTR